MANKLDYGCKTQQVALNGSSKTPVHLPFCMSAAERSNPGVVDTN